MKKEALLPQASQKYKIKTKKDTSLRKPSKNIKTRSKPLSGKIWDRRKLLLSASYTLPPATSSFVMARFARAGQALHTPEQVKKGLAIMKEFFNPDAILIAKASMLYLSMATCP